MAGRLPRVTGAVGSVDTAGQGGFAGIYIYPQGGAAAGVVFSVANTTYCVNMVLPFRCVVGQVNSEVTTLQVGKLYGFGLYDMNGDLVVRTAAQSSTTTGVKTTATTATVTVEPGPYWFCWSADSATIQLMRLNLSNFIQSDSAAPILFTAANDSTEGVLPATLGTLTGSTLPTIHPIAWFTP